MAKKRKKLTEEEKKILEEINATSGKEDGFFKILFEKDTTKEELDEFLTDKEKEEIMHQKQEEKKLIIMIASITSSIFLGLIIFFIIFKYCIKSDLEKYVLPAATDYYNQKYGVKEEVSEIGYLCTDKCSKKILIKMSDGVYLMSLDNGKTFEDNKDNIKIKDTVRDYLNGIATNKDNIINTNIELLYKDYYLTYNMYLDYKGILPSKSFKELLKTKKLDVIATILYTGDINIEGLRTSLKKLGDNSRFYLLKKETVKSDPNSLIILSKKEELSFNIGHGIEKTAGIKVLPIDKSQNGINEVKITKVNANDLLYQKKSKNARDAFAIELNKEWRRKDEEEKPSYYIIKISNKLINVDNVNFYSNSYGGTYKEFEKIDIPEVIVSQNGEEVYLISNTNLTFATINKGVKEPSFWCNLGFC